MATEILFDAIREYCYPLLEAAGLTVDPYGYIVDRNDKKLCMKNPRYQEGDNVEEVSPVLYPMIPLRDSDYLEIKEKIDAEIFNPFSNIKHMIVVAIKMKNLAVVDLSPELLATAIDEDDYVKFDDYVGLSNDINMKGEIDYALVDLYDPNKHEIVRYPCPPDEPIKGLWALCVLMYNKYVSQRPPYLKQFTDIDKSWKKISAAMKKWDKLRKGIVSEIHKEENQTMNAEYMDFSEGIRPGEAIDVYSMPHKVCADDFLMCEDGEDMNGVNLQNYLTSLFLPESLTPYEEHVESDEQIETIVEPETTTFANMKPVEDVKVKPIVKNEEPVELRPVKEVEPQNMTVEVKPEEPKKTNSVFKKSSNSGNLNFNNPMMYGGMMGGMGMMNPMGYGNRPMNSMNMDDLCLGEVIDPYQNYR